MRWLGQWRPAPMAALLIAWIAGTAALLTLYFVAMGRSIERDYTEMGFRLGGTEAQIHVNWHSMLPQLVGYYGVVVVLPPVVFWLLWRRARRAAA
jgi:hypothetical protein